MRKRVPASSAIFQDSLEGPAGAISPGYNSRVRPPPEWYIADSLPEYVAWRTFTHLSGPGKSFVRWLLHLTPPGAEVIPIGARAPPGTRDWPTDDHRTFGAPLIVEAAVPELSRCRSDRRIEIAERMPVADYRRAGRHAPRSGLPMWAMKAAFFRDICGYSTAKIMEQTEFRDFSTLGGEGGSRSARRYAAIGRPALAKLGAWPWCLSSDGRLAPHWYADEIYAAALATWHYQQTLSELGAVLASVECAAGSGDRIGSHSVLEEARSGYRRLYECTISRRARG
jgi:hypothetical protein